MKIRQNGKAPRNWVKNLKGASVGTEAKMQVCLDAIQREYRRLGRETDAEGCEIVKVCEAATSWQAKLEAVNTTKNMEKTRLERLLIPKESVKDCMAEGLNMGDMLERVETEIRKERES